MKKKNKYEEVIPTPTGNKLFVSADMVERESVLIVPEEMGFSDIQKVVEVGEYLKQQNSVGTRFIEEGDTVLLDLSHKSLNLPVRKKTQSEGLTHEGTIKYDDEMTTTREFQVPIYKFGNKQYALIDKDVIVWVWKKDALLAVDPSKN